MRENSKHKLTVIFLPLALQAIASSLLEREHREGEMTATVAGKVGGKRL